MEYIQGHFIYIPKVLTFIQNALERVHSRYNRLLPHSFINIYFTNRFCCCYRYYHLQPERFFHSRGVHLDMDIDRNDRHLVI